MYSNINDAQLSIIVIVNFENQQKNGNKNLRLEKYMERCEDKISRTRIQKLTESVRCKL